MSRNKQEEDHLFYITSLQLLLAEEDKPSTDYGALSRIAVFGLLCVLFAQSTIPYFRSEIDAYIQSNEVAPYSDPVFDVNPKIQPIVDNISLTRHGKQIFLSSQPKLVSKSELDTICPEDVEDFNIIGCYSKGAIYIYDISHPKLSNQKHVTAAHELLHAAYDQIDPTRRLDINRQLEAFYKELDDPELYERISGYEVYHSSRGGFSNREKYTELFAEFGTEYRDLPTSLEDTYSVYFVNRKTVVDLHEQVAGYVDEEVAKLNSLKATQASLLYSADQYYAIHQSCARNWTPTYDCFDSSWANYLAAFARYKSAYNSYYAQWEVVDSITNAYKEDVPTQEAVKGTVDYAAMPKTQ